MGSGKGGYSLLAGGKVGPRGLVLAVDRWAEGLDLLEDEAGGRGLANIRSIQADLGDELPLETETVDVCLMATVLHHLTEGGQAEKALKEAFRLLRPGGLLAVIEFKLLAEGPGPPLEIRLLPEEVERLAGRIGFVQEFALEAGPYNYMVGLRRAG